MLDYAINLISSAPWYYVALTALFFAFLENVFPPSPSDTVILFTGALCSFGNARLPELLIAATLGSSLGFAFMFWLGNKYGKKIIESGKFKILNPRNIEKANDWLEKYGYYAVALNRFLSGTRGVVSFIAGMSKMKPGKTVALAALSAAVWNLILICAGYFLGSNWKAADAYLSKYGLYVAIALALSAAVFLAKKKFSSKK